MKREEEVAVYRQLYEGPYGHRVPRHKYTERWLQEAWERENITSWLDIGCGMFRPTPPSGVLVNRVDPAVGPVFMHAHEIYQNFGADSYDLVTAWDVLEHLLPEELDDVVDQMKKVAKRLVAASVGTEPSKSMPGRELHLTINTPDEWHARLEKAWGPVDRPFEDDLDKAFFSHGLTT